ncbi:TIGR00725 family protein [Fodinibius sp.]|uniref:TIGR00725 family protein n=1 Tax=Fodinibius sp. TaxID=1872440 RepID=UPI002ACE3927|nr:TIGR00725 family protein [Fodinibius sp.]MDZ7660683.1 TIGR00725 family protein [Fodinibius sp.]
MVHTIIGVMGPGNGATQTDLDNAYTLGKLVAEQNWTLLTGGRNVGVMNAASKGASEAGGLVIGILPSENKEGISQFVDIPICTGMGSARNNINVLSSDAVVACGSGAGTTSEIMLALKTGKPLVLLNPSTNLIRFIGDLNYPVPPNLESPQKAVQTIKELL